jgi:DNA-binding NarL/FixJ family response regulator
MSEAFVHPLPPSSRADPFPRLAVALQDESQRDAFVSLLAAGRLPVTAGAVSIDRVEDLLADPPDVLVLVADARRSDVMAALRLVHKRAPATRSVVVVSDDEAVSLHARRMLNTGADAVVARTGADVSLPAAVRAVAAGLVCAPREVRRLVAKPTFSHREKEILGLLVEGMTNRQIASRLFLAESTVKSHLMSSFAKLGVRSRNDAVSLLLDPAEGLAATSLAPARDDGASGGAKE